MKSFVQTDGLPIQFRLSDVSNGSSISTTTAETQVFASSIKEEDDNIEIPEELAAKMNILKPEPAIPYISEAPAIPRVFISHGKNSRVIIGQLKELLTYGQMESIVSVEKETTAISVPDKVFDDMRSCNAGIIHVCPEISTDFENHTVSKLNENVLIEIGAAMALYGKRIIILCQQGTQLPSNLQGLYRCEYVGDQLDYASTMKLLKTLQELRKMM